MDLTAAVDCWFLSGPTASGKSGVGIELAQRLDAEIISLDSMALYRGMDIGTAKPTPNERRAVPHHLIDVIDPDQEYSLAQYVEAAGQCIEEITARKRQVLFVGGTPLYLKGMLRGIFDGPAADEALRQRLVAGAEQHESGYLHQKLAEVDPAAAERLHPNDTRRLVRALEVFEKTGQPISQWQQQFNTGRAAEACRVFVLDWPKEQLHDRIDRRVERMFAEGLVDEVRSLLDRQKHPSKTARQAVGYREVIEHLDGGQNLAKTVELVKIHTRQLSKRQGTWFRSLSECRFLPIRDEIDSAQVAQAIATQPLRPA